MGSVPIVDRNYYAGIVATPRSKVGRIDSPAPHVGSVCWRTSCGSGHLEGLDVSVDCGGRGRSRREVRWMNLEVGRVRLVLGRAVGVALALILGACTSQDGGVSSESGAPAPEVQQLAPDEFADLVEDPDVLVVNVHVPYEGELPGTDAFVDYRDVTDSEEFPADMDAPIALYCMSGNMSGQAGQALLEAGYTDVRELTGGMKRWQETGRNLRFRG